MIYVEDELIKLNGVVLPGLVKSIEVIETAKVDEQEVEGSATDGADQPCLQLHQQDQDREQVGREYPLHHHKE